MKKKLSLLLVSVVLVLTLCLGLVGCSTPVDSETSLTIGAPEGAPSLSLLKTIENGVEGIDNLTIDISTPNLIVSQINSDKYDMMILPTNVAYAKGFIGRKDNDPYVMVATATYGNLYLVSPKTDATAIKIDDLKGALVYSIGQNAIPHKVFEYVASKNNLELNIITDTTKRDAEKINVIFAADGPTVMTAVAGTKETNVYGLLGEPAVTASKVKYGLTNVFDIQAAFAAVQNQETVKGFPQAVLICKKSLVESNPALVKAVINQLKATEEYIKTATMDQKKAIAGIINSNKYRPEGAAEGKTGFPPKALPKCGVHVLSATEAKAETVNLLKEVIGLKAVSNDFFAVLAD